MKRIGVAILDSGIYAKHSEFSGRVLAFKDFINNKNQPYDDNGHGTHVAGVICGRYYGISPQSAVVVLKVLGKDGKGRSADVDRACSYILENKQRYNIRVANVSVGAKIYGKGAVCSMLVKCVEKLWDAGIVVVCAAGNEGPEEFTVTSPGISRKIITVGAVDDEKYIAKKDDRFVNYSGRGPTFSCVIKPDFLCYGHNVMSASVNGGFCRKSGTSMATPKVTGHIANMLAANPDMTPLDVKLKLIGQAVKLQEPIVRQGFGLLDVNR